MSIFISPYTAVPFDCSTYMKWCFIKNKHVEADLILFNMEEHFESKMLSSNIIFEHYLSDQLKLVGMHLPSCAQNTIRS
jgi:hypothetical protein